MSSISVPEPRMLLIKPYEQSMMGEIENAIRNSDLGVNPTNDGQVLRVTIPQLTEERRRDLVKVAKSKGEDGKIAIRNIRRDRKSTRLNSSHVAISYAVFCLKKKKQHQDSHHER